MNVFYSCSLQPGNLRRSAWSQFVWPASRQINSPERGTVVGKLGRATSYGYVSRGSERSDSRVHVLPWFTDVSPNHPAIGPGSTRFSLRSGRITHPGALQPTELSLGRAKRRCSGIFQSTTAALWSRCDVALRRGTCGQRCRQHWQGDEAMQYVSSHREYYTARHLVNAR